MVVRRGPSTKDQPLGVMVKAVSWCLTRLKEDWIAHVVTLEFLEDSQRKTVTHRLSPVSNASSRAVVVDGLQQSKWERTHFQKGLLYLLQISPA